VAGGLLGYALAVATDTVPLLDHRSVTILGLMLVAFVSIILGSKLKLDYAGRLFIMTFILVAMAAPKKSGACPTPGKRLHFQDRTHSLIALDAIVLAFARLPSVRL